MAGVVQVGNGGAAVKAGNHASGKKAGGGSPIKGGNLPGESELTAYAKAQKKKAENGTQKTEFTKTQLDTVDKFLDSPTYGEMNKKGGGLVPIHEVRAHFLKKYPNSDIPQFNNILFELQGRGKIQTMSDDLSRTPQYQKDLGVRGEGSNTRVYINHMKPKLSNASNSAPAATSSTPRRRKAAKQQPKSTAASRASAQNVIDLFSEPSSQQKNTQGGNLADLFG